jgi:hypothetical protein
MNILFVVMVRTSDFSDNMANMATTWQQHAQYSFGEVFAVAQLLS